MFMQQSDKDEEEEETARLLAQKKEEGDPDEVKAKQSKQLHKVEQDILKSEIEAMVMLDVGKKKSSNNSS